MAKPATVNRIQQRRSIDRPSLGELITEQHHHNIEIELLPEEGTVTTSRIWWTDEERNLVAARVAVLRCKAHRESMADLIDQAQRSVLPRDRWRSATGFGADTHTMRLAEEHGLKMAQWYERYAEIDQKLAAYSKLVKNENDFVEILSKDRLSDSERSRLMDLLQPADILKHFRIEELISAASPQHLFTATVAKCLEGGAGLVDKLVSSVEQLNTAVTHLSISGGKLNGHVNGHVNGHAKNGHAAGRILIYGVPDEHLKAQVQEAFPKQPLTYVDPNDLDPHRITADVYKVMVFFNYTSKRQKQLIERRKAELKWPEDKIRKIPGGVDRLINAIRTVLPE